MPADEAGRTVRSLEEFGALVLEDRAFEFLHALLRQLRDVDYAGRPVMTRRGWRIKRYTAACPVNASHRMVVEQTEDGALITCPACEASAAKRARLGAVIGAAVERATGYPVVINAES